MRNYEKVHLVFGTPKVREYELRRDNFSENGNSEFLKDDIIRNYEKVHLVVTTLGQIVANVENYKILCLDEAIKLLSQDFKVRAYESQRENFSETS